MDNLPGTLCFVENAKAFQEGQISTDMYFGNMVEHFRGTRHHPEDDEKVDKALPNLDRIGDLVKTSLWDPSFRPVKDIIPLRNLLVACWKGQVLEVTAQYPVLAESSEYGATASLLLPTMVYITCFRHHPTLLKYCLSVSDNPSLMLSSHPSVSRLAADERASPEIWDVLLGAGWYAGKTGALINKAINMRTQRGTKLLQVVTSHGAQIETYALGKAARFGDAAGLGVLLEHCTPQQINVSNALSMSAISYFDPIEKMNILLEKGADIDFIASTIIYDPDIIQAYTEHYTWGQINGTALHLAAEWGLEDAVKFLLAKDARTDIKDAGGKYAMERAEKVGHLGVRDLIWKAFEKEWKEN